MILRKNHGKALILDGIIQCTENDEFSYQEMISFLPLCAHPHPEKVLIVGGGDGGVAREVSKHPLVKQIVQVEIDELVVEVAKKYIPAMSVGFASPKLELLICDGFKFMKEHRNEFDVIITDSSDPIGPAVNLFTSSYFKLLREALRPRGVICSQAGTYWSNLNHVRETMQNCKEYFPVVKYATTNVPTYPSGQIGFVVASTDQNNKIHQPKIMFNQEQIGAMNLRCYNTQMHSAAFVLPNFVNKTLYFWKNDSFFFYLNPEDDAAAPFSLDWTNSGKTYKEIESN